MGCYCLGFGCHDVSFSSVFMFQFQEHFACMGHIKDFSLHSAAGNFCSYPPLLLRTVGFPKLFHCCMLVFHIMVQRMVIFCVCAPARWLIWTSYSDPVFVCKLLVEAYEKELMNEYITDDRRYPGICASRDYKLSQ